MARGRPRSAGHRRGRRDAASRDGAYGDETSWAENASEGFSLNLMSMGLRIQSAFKRTVALFEEVNASLPPSWEMQLVKVAGIISLTVSGDP
jgi:hypothetical protein